MRRMILLFVIIGVVARLVWFLLPAAIWGDEAMLGLNFLTRDYAGLTHQLDHAQVAPILFLWSEKWVVDTFGMAEWSVRLLPLLASLAGLLLFWDFARRVVPPTAAVFGVGLVAVSTCTVTMGVTLKPYAGDLFWSALLLALAARWHQRPERRWPLYCLPLAVPFAIGSSYPVVFVAGGISLYLLPLAWRSGWSARLLFACYNALLLASFGAVYLLVAHGQGDPASTATGEFMRTYWRSGFPPDSLSEVPLWVLDRHTARAFAYPTGDKRGASSLTTLLFLCGIVWCWRNGSRPLLVACLVPFALNLIASILGKYPYTADARLSQHLTPAICLLAGVGCSAVLSRCASRLDARLVLARWGVALLVLFAVESLVVRCFNRDHDAFARFAKFFYLELNAACRPQDRIVMPEVNDQDAPTLWYLARLGNRVITVRPGDPPPAGERIWVVTPQKRIPNPEAHAEFIRSLKLTDYRVGHTTWYTVRASTPPSDRGVYWLCYGVTCLTPTGDSEPAIPLNAVP